MPIRSQKACSRRRRRRPGHVPLLWAAVLVALVVSVAVLRLEAASGRGPIAGRGSASLLAGLGQGGAKAQAPDSEQVAVPGTALAAHACTAFAPLGPDRSRTVFVDPGHGGPDPGASANSVQEETAALAVGLELAKRLRSDGYRVVLSRVGDSSVAALPASAIGDSGITITGVHLENVARIACANAAAADMLVAIHFNAFDDPTVGGAETIYDDARPFGDRNLRLAKLVQAAVEASFSAKGWQVPDRGVQTDAAAGTPALSGAGQAYGRLMELGPAQPGFVDHPSQMPGVVVEPLFLTRPAEAAVAADPTGQAAMAEGLRQGIEKFLTGG